jgi:hypothetical protein
VPRQATAPLARIAHSPDRRVAEPNDNARPKGETIVPLILAVAPRGQAVLGSGPFGEARSPNEARAGTGRSRRCPQFPSLRGNQKCLFIAEGHFLHEKTRRIQKAVGVENKAVTDALFPHAVFVRVVKFEKLESCFTA